MALNEYLSTAKWILGALALILIGAIVLALLWTRGGQDSRMASRQHRLTGATINGEHTARDAAGRTPAFRVIEQGRVRHISAQRSR